MLDATPELSWQEGSAPAESQSYALDVDAGSVPAAALASRREERSMSWLSPKLRACGRCRKRSHARNGAGLTAAACRSSSPEVAGVAPSRQAEKICSMPECRWGSDTDYFPLLSKLDLMQVMKPAGATTLPVCAK
jgi:hypothetical protein